MFDFRYHALSLAAVFVALMIGLLLGVAIGDQGLVSGADRGLRDSLRSDVRKARAESAELRTNLAQQRRIQQQLYPLLVEGRLTGQRIGLVGLGGLPDEVVRYVRDALKDTGGRLTAVTVIREPVPGTVIPGLRPNAPPPDRVQFQRFGVQFGMALVRGGGLVQRVQRSLLQSSSGELRGMTSVILYRNPRDESTPDQVTTRGFEQGLAGGLSSGGIQVVGVELTDTQPSQIPWFGDRRLASVDCVDQVVGQAALVFALAGANGAYGVKDTAQALVPTAGAPAP